MKCIQFAKSVDDLSQNLLFTSDFFYNIQSPVNLVLTDTVLERITLIHLRLGLS